jgi:hypothetical protein
MSLPDVVRCADGTTVARRGAGAQGRSATYRVAGVAGVRPPPSAPVEAHRRDLFLWRRHWTTGSTLVIEFVDVCLVEVDEARGTITFDRHLSDEMEEHLLLDHVLPLTLARRGRLVVHGAVVGRLGAGAVLVGDSGAGKSTLTAFLHQQGWTVGGDDGAVLRAGDPPTAEPTYPTVRLTPESFELLGLAAERGTAILGKVRVAADEARPYHGDPVELRLVAILEPAAQGEAARFEPLEGVEAHAQLFGSTFHAELGRGRHLPAVVEELAMIVETTRVGRLWAPRGLDGLVATERALTEIVMGPRPTAGSDWTGMSP